MFPSPIELVVGFTQVSILRILRTHFNFWTADPESLIISTCLILYPYVEEDKESFADGVRGCYQLYRLSVAFIGQVRWCWRQENSHALSAAKTENWGSESVSLLYDLECCSTMCVRVIFVVLCSFQVISPTTPMI